MYGLAALARQINGFDTGRKYALYAQLMNHQIKPFDPNTGKATATTVRTKYVRSWQHGMLYNWP